jgi:F-box protein 9
MMEESNPELESFRQLWKAEVTARARAEGGNKEPQSSTAESSKTTRRPPAAPRIPTGKGSKDDDTVEPQIYHDLGRSSGVDRAADGTGSMSGGKQPQSALEHYEKAVERESAGVLGDSLDLYRKAFKVGSVVRSARPCF